MRAGWCRVVSCAVLVRACVYLRAVSKIFADSCGDALRVSNVLQHDVTLRHVLLAKSKLEQFEIPELS